MRISSGLPTCSSSWLASSCETRASSAEPHFAKISESTVASSIRSVLLVLVDMTSTTDWSERTTTEQQPPNSPSRMIAGDDHIAECSDLFREAIQARNVYAAWARKLTNARPNDPKLQSYHQEVTKAGESVELLLVKLNVPLFRIPASEKELDRIVLRVKNRVSDPPAEKNEEEKKPAAVPPPPSSPRSKGRKAKRSVDADGFAPPKQLVRKVRSPRSTPPPSPTPSSAPILDSATLEEQGEEGMDTNIDVPLSQEEVPVATKSRASRRSSSRPRVIGGSWWR
ncbi:hypothetical protein TNCV_161441 [Trichonephila clavipes]|nr:hypothetical protein TNCV_161441 [Trichonephila clavipes]